MMPPQHPANARLGPIKASVAAATGLLPACEVACGIHDSNASYLRFLMDREREAFTVVSSGTWTIVMANRGDLRRLVEQRGQRPHVQAELHARRQRVLLPERRLPLLPRLST
jgi:sugar (pentulose or hexulose) kinase